MFSTPFTLFRLIKHCKTKLPIFVKDIYGVNSKYLSSVNKQFASQMSTAEISSEALAIKNEEGTLKRQADDDVDDNVKKIKTETNHIRREKARKMAMLLGYCGTGYFGMQKNPEVRTIEQDLLQAMLKIGLIEPKAAEVPQEMNFQRAARTDKGVSAIRQVVSMKLAVSTDLHKVVSNINEHLPNEIRVFGIKRVTKGFDSKNSCDFRTYCYMLPSFAFAPKEVDTLTEEYRISDDQLQLVNKFLGQFKGTHNFHNFTAGRKPDDDSCKRYLVACECGKPFIQDGFEFLKVKLKGQSFMLHQIRKLIGFTIAHFRGFTKPDSLIKAWAPAKVDIPIAPGLGLMLDFVHYEHYDKKFGGNGIHESLDWVEFQEEINNFATEHIIPHIIQTEKTEKSMLAWMELLPLHSYDIRIPGPPPQTIDTQTEQDCVDKTPVDTVVEQAVICKS